MKISEVSDDCGGWNVYPVWQPIETAPHEELVVLGWYEGDVWKQEIAIASAGNRWENGYSNMWQHGRATHWMPLPAAPEAEGGKMQSKEMPERDARRDIGILLAQIDWLQECTGETLEAEDAALLHQIRRDWSGAAPDAPQSVTAREAEPTSGTEREAFDFAMRVYKETGVTPELRRVYDFYKNTQNERQPIETVAEALEIVNRVFQFNLNSMIVWGDDYNQAVKDAADAVATALRALKGESDVR